jgi:hypothetical protein
LLKSLIKFKIRITQKMTIESSRQLLTAKDRIAARAEKAFKESVSKPLPDEFKVIIYINDEDPTKNQSQQSEDQENYGFCRVRSQFGHNDMLRDPMEITNKQERESAIQAHPQAYYKLNSETMPESFDIWSATIEDGIIRLNSLIERQGDLEFKNSSSPKGAKDAFGSGQKSIVGSQENSSSQESFIYVGPDSNFKNKEIRNGEIPQSLIGKAKKGGIFKARLMKEIVPKYDELCEAFRKEFPTIQLSGVGYRSLQQQVDLKKQKPRLAAVPGTSNHGWGLAVDLLYFSDSAPNQQIALTYDSKQWKWLKKNVSRFGFEHPSWAGQGGKKEEPWHFEWANKSEFIKEQN